MLTQIIFSWVLLPFVICELFPVGSSHVFELDCGTYREQVDSTPDSTSPDWVILHYSSMCGHCKRFGSTFADLAFRYKDSDQVKFGAIDLYEPCNHAIIKEKNIRRVPLLQRFEVVHDLPGGPSRIATTLQTNSETLLSLFDSLYGGEGALEKSNMGSKSKSLSLRNDPLSFLIDATSALSYTLNKEVFPGDASIMPAEDVEDLKLILRVCASNFGLNSVRADCESLHNALPVSGEVTRSTWDSLLSTTHSFSPASTVSRLLSCESPTCALWRLLHVFTIETDHTTVTPQEAMMGIRALVDKFMSCEECRTHFLAHFDGCDFGRCESPNVSWKSTTLWLWRFHNAVTQRVQSEPLIWPSVAECPACTDEDSVYDFLIQKFSLGTTSVRRGTSAGNSVSYIAVVITLLALL